MSAKHSNVNENTNTNSNTNDYIHYEFTGADDSLYPSTGSARAAKRSPLLLGGAALAVAVAIAGVVAFNAPKVPPWLRLPPQPSRPCRTMPQPLR